MLKYLRFIFLIILLFGVSACKTELYSNLTEHEANEILAALLPMNIPAEKTAGAENTWVVTVNKSNFSRSIEILKENGIPKDRFVSMGDVFKKEGLVSSPTEDRIRFIYALSQKISEMINQIDGVLVARTNIVIPQNDPFTDKFTPASASIFIKYKQGSDVQTMVPQIKRLVVNSVEGLDYEKVTVALFPSQSAFVQNEPNYVNIFGMIDISKDSLIPFWLIFGFLILFSVGVCGFSAYILLIKPKNIFKTTQKN